MPNFTAEGIRTPAITDNYSLADDLRKMAESIETVVPVANKTARSALVTALTAAGRPPTAENPLIVVRADAAGDPIEITKDGTTWTARPTVSTVGGYGPSTGYPPPPGTRVITYMFNAIGFTNASSVFAGIAFPNGGFLEPPIINGLVMVAGGGANPVVYGGFLTAVGVDLYVPGSPSTGMRIHITVTGWINE